MRLYRLTKDKTRHAQARLGQTAHYLRLYCDLKTERKKKKRLTFLYNRKLFY